MTILTQDMARQFLSNSSNVDKYKFFNKGVQLEQLDKDYCLIWNCIKNTEQILETKKEAVSVLKVEVEKTKERLGQFQAQDGMRARKGELQLQMAWVQVRDKEMLLEDHDTLIESQRRRLARAEEYRDKASADYDSLDTDHEAAKARIEEELAKLAPFDDQKAQFKEEFEKNKDSLLSIVVCSPGPPVNQLTKRHLGG